MTFVFDEIKRISNAYHFWAFRGVFLFRYISHFTQKKIGLYKKGQLSTLNQNETNYHYSDYVPHRIPSILDTFDEIKFI